MKEENELKNENRLTSIEKDMKYLKDEMERNTKETRDGFKGVADKLSIIEQRIAWIAQQQEKDSEKLDGIAIQVDDHVDPEQHSKLVVQGLGRRLIGETWFKRLLSVIIVMGITVLLFPIEEVRKRIDMILTLLRLK